MFARFDWKSYDGLRGFLLFLTPKKNTFVDKFIPIPAFYRRGNKYLLHIYPPFFSYHINKLQLIPTPTYHPYGYPYPDCNPIPQRFFFGVMVW